MDEAITALAGHVRQRLEADLRQRLAANQRHFWWVTAPLTASLLLYLYLMIGAYLSLRETVARVRDIAARVNAQDLSQHIEIVGQDELAAGRPGRAEMREDHQLGVLGGHRDQKSSSSSSVALRSRTRWVRSRAARAASAGSDSDSRSSSVLPGAMASR